MQESLFQSSANGERPELNGASVGGMRKSNRTIERIRKGITHKGNTEFDRLRRKVIKELENDLRPTHVR